MFVNQTFIFSSSSASSLFFIISSEHHVHINPSNTNVCVRERDIYRLKDHIIASSVGYMTLVHFSHISGSF